MPRRRRIHINWPFWGTVFLIAAVLVGSVVLSAWYSVASRPLGNLSAIAERHRAEMAEAEWERALLSHSFAALIGLWFFVVGSSIGSFLNVVAYRVPLGMSINGFSRCPFCKVGIRGEDNIPLLGWLRLRGRCRACRLPIPARYPGYELLGGGVAMFLFVVEFLSHGQNLPIADRPPSVHGMLVGQMDWDSLLRTLHHLLLVYFLIAVAMISWGGKIAPKGLFLVGVFASGLVASICPDSYPVAWRTAAASDGLDLLSKHLLGLSTWAVGGIGGAIFGFATWLPYLLTARVQGSDATRSIESTLRRKDFDLSIAWIGSWTMLGSFVGWQGVVSIGWISLMVSLGFSVYYRIVNHRDHWDPAAWLWLATLIHLAAWRSTQNWIWAPGAINGLPPGWMGPICILVTLVGYGLFASFHRNSTMDRNASYE